MADKRISQLIERVDIANNDVLPIVASGATTTNKVTVSTLQDWMQENLDVGVTSVGITIGSTGTDVNVTGSPITTSGNITINIPTASATNRGLLSSSDWTTFNNKLSSVGLTMPSAFTVTNSPLTSNGTIAVTGAGTVGQYIRGDGSLADFPSSGGGGASVSYYLNGSVSQGTIGGIAYQEVNKTPIIGAGTDFTINANGYIASFITDAGDPGLLEIPAGNWNFESYFSASSGGGTPSFYVELYKVNSAGTPTLIASGSAAPELIAFGTAITPYFSNLAVPFTTLALTDRLALRYYVTHSGRTITLHTENSHLCQIITTFTTGITALNGLTAQVQNFATGTSGTDFAISSTSATHTFNLPDASATARGVVTTGIQTIAGIKTFTSNMNADGGVRLPATGTTLPTFVNNISGSGLSSSGSNGFGFNNANNFYFSGSDKGGSVFVVNNTATRNYTFQDTSGVIALTSNIPANPVGGSGTINQIPKYTSSTTTIGNSNISDNGSDVVIASRTGISLSGQSILLTPNLGGTTNRIETTGGLPLALVTSGSSITLAAGGTTPQITLASTGAVTLTGALNGTSASFSGLVTINSDSGGSALRLIGRSAGDSSAIRFFANNNSTQNARIESNSSEFEINSISNLPLTFKTNDTTRLTIASTGAATFSSTARIEGQFLQVVNASAPSVYINNTAVQWRSYLPSNNYAFSDAVRDVLTLGYNGSPSFFQGCNVGIGTASPNRLTEIVGSSGATLGVSTSSSGSSILYGRLAMYSTAASNSYIEYGGEIRSYSGAGIDYSDLRFYTAGGSVSAERMRITSGGYLWSSNSSYSGSSSNHQFNNNTNGNTTINFYHQGTDPYGLFTYFTGAAPNNTTNYFAYFRDTSGAKCVIFSNGNIQNSNNSYGAFSDIKLKENIQDATPKLEDLLKVKIRNYNLIGEETKQIGVIAQELEEVFPGLVDESEDFEEVEVPQLDEEGNEVLNEEGEVVTTKERVSKGTTTKSVKYSVFVPMLIKAIQELKAEIDSLKTK
jgi:hypothetical protein